MASTNLTAIMRRDERRRAMLRDPALTRELLMVVLALDEVFEARAEQGLEDLDRSWVGEVTSMVRNDQDGRWIVGVVAADAPRYAPTPTEPGRVRQLCTGSRRHVRRPVPISGGALGRYFPDYDWTPVYRWAGAEPDIPPTAIVATDPPTTAPQQQPGSPRPVLRLVHDSAAPRTGTPR